MVGGRDREDRLHGLSAASRIVAAVENLCLQFAICGQKQPVAILLEAGEQARVMHMCADSPLLLLEDRLSAQPQIWGVHIREEEAIP